MLNEIQEPVDSSNGFK